MTVDREGEEARHAGGTAVRTNERINRVVENTMMRRNVDR